MNTKDVGNTTEAMVLAALVRAGRNVLVPWGDNLRYDLAYDDHGKLVRVQCKTGRLKDGAIVVSTCSTYAHRGGSAKGYRDEADLFGIYCPATDKVYLIPVNDCGSRTLLLRVKPTKNNQTTFVRWAKDYEITVP